jgi:hypothetical protein
VAADVPAVAIEDSPKQAPENSIASEGERIRNYPSSLRIGALRRRASISDPKGRCLDMIRSLTPAASYGECARCRIQAVRELKAGYQITGLPLIAVTAPSLAENLVYPVQGLRFFCILFSSLFV